MIDYSILRVYTATWMDVTNGSMFLRGYHVTLFCGAFWRYKRVRVNATNHYCGTWARTQLPKSNHYQKMCRGNVTATKGNRLTFKYRVKRQNRNHLDWHCTCGRRLSVIAEEKEEDHPKDCELMAERRGRQYAVSKPTQQRSDSVLLPTNQTAGKNHTLRPGKSSLSLRAKQPSNENDIKAMQAVFPDFFPRSLAPVNYAGDQPANALEELFCRQNETVQSTPAGDKENIVNWFITEYGLPSRWDVSIVLKMKTTLKKKHALEFVAL